MGVNSIYCAPVLYIYMDVLPATQAQPSSERLYFSHPNYLLLLISTFLIMVTLLFPHAGCKFHNKILTGLSLLLPSIELSAVSLVLSFCLYLWNHPPVHSCVDLPPTNTLMQVQTLVFPRLLQYPPHLEIFLPAIPFICYWHRNFPIVQNSAYHFSP